MENVALVDVWHLEKVDDAQDDAFVQKAILDLRELEDD